MDDIEKSRIEYVGRMEETLQHLQRQLGEAKPLADKWTPVVAVDSTGADVRVTVGFGGKRVTVNLNKPAFVNGDVTQLTSATVDAVIKNIVFDLFAAEVKPHIEKQVRAVSAIQGAGKW